MPKCLTCRTEILWMKTKEGKSMPVNISGKDGMPIPFADKVFDHAKHVSHFSNCPGAKKWRGTHRKSHA